MNTCTRCNGCGQLANTDTREPWTAWTSLPLQSSLAVLAGLVRPIPCDACIGTGQTTADPTVPVGHCTCAHGEGHPAGHEPTCGHLPDPNGTAAATGFSATENHEAAQPQEQVSPKRETSAQADIAAADNAAFEIALDALRQRDIGKLLAEVVARVVDATAPQLIHHGRRQGREMAGAEIESAATARARAAGWTPDPAEDLIPVEFAARIARGGQATEESSDA